MFRIVSLLTCYFSAISTAQDFDDSFELQRRAFELANRLVETADDPATTALVYEQSDPKVYDAMC